MFTVEWKDSDASSFVTHHFLAHLFWSQVVDGDFSFASFQLDLGYGWNGALSALALNSLLKVCQLLQTF